MSGLCHILSVDHLGYLSRVDVPRSVIMIRQPSHSTQDLPSLYSRQVNRPSVTW